jgi:hypothetical protein
VVSQATEPNAVSLFNAQLTKVERVRQLDFRHPEFMNWHDTTLMLFQRFLPPDSPHFSRFRDLRFRESSFVPARKLPFSYRGPRPGPDTTISPEDKQRFESACEIAAGCIEGAIDEILSFGVHVDTGTRKAPRRSGGFQQNFNAPVTIGAQAIATDNAIQNIQHSGGTGVSLQEIAALLNQSLELTGRERIEGLKAIETIATEIHRPEQSRDWNTVLESGEKLVSIAGKATDLASKLAPYVGAITGLIGQATKHLGR